MAGDTSGSMMSSMSGFFMIDEQGQIFLKRIKNTYVRGLTIKELTRLLEKRYEEFLLNPEIYIKMTRYKNVRASISGEVREPGLYKFPAYNSQYSYPPFLSGKQSNLNYIS